MLIWLRQRKNTFIRAKAEEFHLNGNIKILSIFCRSEEHGDVEHEIHKMCSIRSFN